MFIFKKIKLRRKDTRKHIAVAWDDWINLKSLSKKQNKPMMQLIHDAITVFVGFIYGVDHATSLKLQKEVDLIGSEFKRSRDLLKVYIERFGEIDLDKESNEENRSEGSSNKRGK